jgi:hypothetical protein
MLPPSSGDTSWTRRSILYPFALVLAGLWAAVGAQTQTDWPAVAGDLGGMKYAPVDEITPANVSRLAEAWSYTPSGAAPLVINKRHVLRRRRQRHRAPRRIGHGAWKFPLTQATTGGAIRPRHELLAGRRRAGAARARHDERRQTGPARRETGQLVPDVGVIDLVAGIMDRIPAARPTRLRRPSPSIRNVAIFPGPHLASTIAGAFPAICAASICSPARKSGASTPCRIRAIRTSARGA